jgi:hypothetical protein
MSTTPQDLRRWANEEEPETESVRLQPGQAVIGRLVRKRIAVTEFGPAGVVTLDRGEGKPRVDVWLFHAVLQAQWREWQPQIGETVGIKRLPDGKNAKGVSYKNFEVRVAGREPQSPDFDAFFADKRDVNSITAAALPEPQSVEEMFNEDGGDNLPF